MKKQCLLPFIRTMNQVWDSNLRLKETKKWCENLRKKITLYQYQPKPPKLVDNDIVLYIYSADKNDRMSQSDYGRSTQRSICISTVPRGEEFGQPYSRDQCGTTWTIEMQTYQTIPLLNIWPKKISYRHIAHMSEDIHGSVVWIGCPFKESGQVSAGTHTRKHRHYLLGPVDQM